MRFFVKPALAALLLVSLVSACGLGGGEGAGGGAIGDLVGSGPANPSSHGFVWPVTGRIVVPFGPRFGRMHEGIDIGSRYGTPIHAAASGKVTYTGWVDGYGSLTMIDTGHDGIETLYGHQSQIVVAVGQHVVRGKVIGYVGCSGFCVTPNVHFEVRLEGLAVDPVPYLS